MKPVPDGIVVEPAEISAKLSDLLSTPKDAKLPTAKIMSDGSSHVAIKEYLIANVYVDGKLNNECKSWFKISENGEFSILPNNSSFDAGIYTFDFKLTTYIAGKDSQKGIFKNALTLNVTSVPTKVTYSPALVKVEKGGTGKSAAPAYKGSVNGLKYAIKSVAPNNEVGITVDQATGVLNFPVTDKAEVGDTYKVSLTVTNDFGSTDVQKTAIVVAMGIDREDDTFIVTTQIAVPQSSKQETSTQSVQIVSRGKTVGEALEEINAKTGWYPKLVFCDLIILGETAKTADVFDCLDFFLRNEYFAEDCLLAVCEKTAKETLNVTTPIDSASSVAAQKILSAHAKQVGASMPNTLREFSAAYFSESKSGFLPILKTEATQDPISGESQDGKSGGNANESQANGNAQPTNGSSGQNQNSGGEATKKEELFSAKETAMFVNGKMVGKLTDRETFAFCGMTSNLKLATYSVESGGKTYTLTVKHNSPNIKLRVDKNGAPRVDISLNLTAGVLDFSKSESENVVKDTSDTPKRVLKDAELALKADVEKTFAAAQEKNCDLFGLTELLKKYEHKYFEAYKNDLLRRATPTVRVTVKSIR
jgi:Ger(x)C family germination protein